MLLRGYWHVVHPRTRGVKCVLRDGDAVLLVRHTYGDRDRWELPGGGVKRGEHPRDTARREMREELGIDLEEWRALGSVESRSYGKRTTLLCFEATVDGRNVTIDEAELQEARWFALSSPPAPLGLDARAILAGVLGHHVASTRR